MPKRNAQREASVAEMTALIDRYLAHIKPASAETTVTDRGELLHRVDDALPMGLAKATTEELEDWLCGPAPTEDNPQPWSRETRKNYYNHLVGFFRWASGPDGRLDYDPTAGMIRPRAPQGIPKPATFEEVCRALEELLNPWKLYVALAAYAGARCCEIAALQRKDVSARTIRLTGKGDKVRVLKTHRRIWELVEPLPPGPVARRIYKGGPVTAAYVSNGVRWALGEIGLDLSAHAFRHWFGTTALKPKEFGGGGASLRTVQELLGHASPSTTAIYTLVSPEERADAIDALPGSGPAAW